MSWFHLRKSRRSDVAKSGTCTSHSLRTGHRLRLEKLEGRLAPSVSGQFWLLQLEGLSPSGEIDSMEQSSAIQRRLSEASVEATVVRHLGVDGLTLVELPTEQTYEVVVETMSQVAGFRFVRPNALDDTPLFSTDPNPHKVRFLGSGLSTWTELLVPRRNNFSTPTFT